MSSPSKQEIERMTTVELAAFCQRVADNSAAYLADDADTARQMKREWADLQAPRNPIAREERKIEMKREALRRRMEIFLAAAL
jgi:hypothetical protein